MNLMTPKFFIQKLLERQSCHTRETTWEVYWNMGEKVAEKGAEKERRGQRPDSEDMNDRRERDGRKRETETGRKTAGGQCPP